jgi:hypothetical protein
METQSLDQSLMSTLTGRRFIFGDNGSPVNISPVNISPVTVSPVTVSPVTVSPVTGCEFVVGIDSDKLVLFEREIRGEFQSPRPNYESRGEFQSPRLNTRTNIDNVPVFDLNSYFIPIITEKNQNEQPIIMCPKVNNPKVNNPKVNNPKVNNPKETLLSVNTTKQSIYKESILLDEYHDNVM